MGDYIMMDNVLDIKRNNDLNYLLPDGYAFEEDV